MTEYLWAVGMQAEQRPIHIQAQARDQRQQVACARERFLRGAQVGCSTRPVDPTSCYTARLIATTVLRDMSSAHEYDVAGLDRNVRI